MFSRQIPYFTPLTRLYSTHCEYDLLLNSSHWFPLPEKMIFISRQSERPQSSSDSFPTVSFPLRSRKLDTRHQVPCHSPSTRQSIYLQPYQLHCFSGLLAADGCNDVWGSRQVPVCPEMACGEAGASESTCRS